MNDLFLNFFQPYNKGKILKKGRLRLDSLSKGNKKVWTAYSSTAKNQHSEGFHDRYHVIPPDYRLPGVPHYEVLTKPIWLPNTPGVNGWFYKIEPYEVITDKNGKRSDLGIHQDTNLPGSAGCIVMSKKRMANFHEQMQKLAKAKIERIPLLTTAC